MNMNDSGFEIVSTSSALSTTDVVVQVLVTTQYQNIRKLDPLLHRKLITHKYDYSMIFLFD